MEVAGQTVFHCHVHLIPRRKGDVKNPRGGVRHVISGKGDYKIDNLLKAENYKNAKTSGNNQKMKNSMSWSLKN